ncbi:MAG: hypothetical protein HY261_01325 [Chloroflexi bacterium]|nr:hypothetical protein [Chloroflexota bacterium]
MRKRGGHDCVGLRRWGREDGDAEADGGSNRNDLGGGYSYSGDAGHSYANARSHRWTGGHGHSRADADPCTDAYCG